jgi:hypothetical protein
MGRHGGSTRIRAPRLRGMLGTHKRGEDSGVWYPTLPQWQRLQDGQPVKGVRLAPATPKPAPNVRQKRAQGGARANVAARRGAGPNAAQAKQLMWKPEANDRYFPKHARGSAPGPPAKLREPSKPARAEANRRAEANPTKPHPKSGEGARSNVKAKARAARPASPMPGDPTPVARGRRNPEGNGKAFAGRFFR